jgi:hypothetical protein
VQGCERQGTYLAVNLDIKRHLQDASRAGRAAIESCVAKDRLSGRSFSPTPGSVGVFEDVFDGLLLSLHELLARDEEGKLGSRLWVEPVVDAGDLKSPTTVTGWQLIDGKAAVAVAAGLDVKDVLANGKFMFWSHLGRR